MFSWLEEPWYKLKQIFTGIRAPHSVILYGTDGLGKKEMAKELATLFLCSSKSLSGYCGKCQSCTLMANSTHPDFHLLETIGNEKISIDKIREIIQEEAIVPRISSGKVFIIENVENMTTEAANALLKVLEEPSGKTLFILTADNITRILPTILSRCIHFRIQNPSFAVAKSWMHQNLQDRNIYLTEPIYAFNGQSPLDTVRFYNDGYYKMLQSLAQMFSYCVRDASCTERLVELLTQISVKKQQAAEDKKIAQTGEKSKVKSFKLRLSDVYDMLYALISDVLRYRVTGRLDRNVIMQSSELMGHFASISDLALDRALNDLTERLRREYSMPNTSAGLCITAWFNNMIGK